jgi:hypothetical protein
MEPMHSVSYDLEFQKQSSASEGSSRKPSVEVPADQELNLLRARQARIGVRAIDQAKMKPPAGCNSLTPLDMPDVLVEASEKMNFDWPDSLSIERAKAGFIEIALAFLLLAGLVTFGLACLLSPTFLA